MLPTELIDKSKEFVVKCSNCRLCPGAAYQSPPVSYVGRLSGRVLIIAQNPGQMDLKNDPNRGWWSKAVSTNVSMNDPLLMKTWYEWDFGTSPGQKKFEWLTKKGWLSTGDFCYSNAVRCRTKDNSQPQIEMVTNCAEHSRALIDMWIEATISENRRLLVLVGATSLISFKRLFDVPADFVTTWGIPFAYKGLGTVLPIKHYAAWRGDSNRFRKAFQEAYESLAP